MKTQNDEYVVDPEDLLITRHYDLRNRKQFERVKDSYEQKKKAQELLKLLAPELQSLQF